MAGWVKAPTGQPVYQDDAGNVHLVDASGKVEAVAPEHVAELLSNPERTGYSPATPQHLEQQQAQRDWEDASAGTKADFYAREGVKGVVDAVTGLPRFIGAGGKAIAEKINPEVESIANPLEALSGENLVEKLDSVVASPAEAEAAAEQARHFSEAAPGGKLAADIAGFVAGGALLKGAGVAGRVLSGSELFGAGSKAGRIASLASEGATQGYIGGAEEAWVKDHEFTSDAMLASAGMGAVFGGGLGILAEGGRAAVSGAKSVLAEKVFGKAPAAAGVSAEAVEQMAADVTGATPPKGFAGYFKEAMEGLREKVETVQSAVSGIPKADLEKYGGLRWTEEAIGAREMAANRGPILEAVSGDLTKSLDTMYQESRPIMDEVSRATGRKLENIKPLLTGDTETMMAAAQGKAAQLTEALGKLDEVTGRGYSVLGEGKATENLRYIFEDAIDKVGAAKEPAAAVHALDEFKAAMQKSKVNSEAVARASQTELGITQARARAQFANDVSEGMRGFLEDSGIWGKFGETQARVNKAYAAMLDSNRYVSSHILEKVGDDFGVPRYQVDPAKVASFVDKVGTVQTQTIDTLLRDNIAARRELVEAIQEGYGLDTRAEGLAKVREATANAQKLLDKARDTVASSNIVDAMMEKASSAHGNPYGANKLLGAQLGGIPGAVAGMAIDVLTNPAKLMKQAVALREIGLKWGSKIDGSVKALVDGTGTAARAARATGAAVSGAGRYARTTGERYAASNVEQTKKYDKIAKNLVTAMADPVGSSQKIGATLGNVDHSMVRDSMISGAMRAASFLNSKLPAAVYGGSPLAPNQVTSVAPTQKARFLRYYEAVQNPAMVFEELKTGNVPPEHIESLKVCYPALYQRAQLAVFDAVHSKENEMPLQKRLALAELFDNPGAIEPTLDPAFMSRLSQTAQQGNVSEKAQDQKASAAIRPMAPMGQRMSTGLDKMMH